jgi:hypothetical protein
MTNKSKTAGVVLSFILLFLLSVLLLLLLPMEVDATSDVDALAFFRATDDKEKYRSALGAYESEPVRGQMHRQFYTERRVAHQVSIRDIEAVRVKKAIGYGSQSDYWRAMIDEKMGRTKKTNTAPVPGAYVLIFRIAENEAKRLGKFNNANLHQSFQIKITGRSIGVIEFLFPYEPESSDHQSEFTFHLQEDDPNDIKVMLLPFSGKVSWE